MTVRWFSPGTPVSSTNKTDHHDITEKLLKVALNTITLTQIFIGMFLFCRNFRGDIATGSCKSIYHTIMSMTATFEKNQNIKTFQYMIQSRYFKLR
jgi:hypothetical protein